MKKKVALYFVLILIEANVVCSQTYKTILQHPLLSMDSSTMENLSLDSLEWLLSDYEDQVNSSLR